MSWIVLSRLAAQFSQSRSHKSTGVTYRYVVCRPSELNTAERCIAEP